jgi:hypothetical protein
MMLGGIGRSWEVSMDEQKLREHYEKTGNLMGILRDPEVLREMVKAEDECMGSIGAGFPAYSNNPQPVDPEKLRLAMYRMRLQSLLFMELETMMNLAGLGVGTEVAIVEARRRILQRLWNLSEDQRSFFEALVAEELSASLDKPLRLQLRGRIYSLLLIDDWNAVWQMATNVLQNPLNIL